jgi:hypothetical protein
MTAERDIRQNGPALWTALLLRALAAGIPMIATPACGLTPRPGLALVPEDNPEALVAAIRSVAA